MFFGTPEWAVSSLEALLDAGIDVAAVVTNPDRPAGRGMERRPSPVKLAAGRAGLPVLQPRSARDPFLLRRVAELDPDAGVVVAYGRILPGSLLRSTRLGFVNLHFSQLPAYRGAAPVQRAIMDGADATGVTVMLLSEGMDEGPVLASERVPIAPDETAGELGTRLARLGAPLLVRALTGYAAGRLEPRPQDHSRATYAPRLTPEEARVDWTRPAAAIANLVRALNPAPGAWTTLRRARLKLWRVAPTFAEAPLEPGQLRPDAELLAGTGAGVLVLREVQLAGRRRMTGAEFARGQRLCSDDRLA